MSPAVEVLGVLQQIVDLLTDPTSGCAVAPEPCRVAVYPGVQVPWDTCGDNGCTSKDGQLWANLVSFTATGQGECERVTFTAIVGVVRCEKGRVRDDGKLPRVEDTEADATQQAADADSIWEAFHCCVNRPDSLRDVSLTNWTALGPSGGCVGGQWTITGVLDTCC